MKTMHFAVLVALLAGISGARADADPFKKFEGTYVPEGETRVIRDSSGTCPSKETERDLTSLTGIHVYFDDSPAIMAEELDLKSRTSEISYLMVPWDDEDEDGHFQILIMGNSSSAQVEILNHYRKPGKPYSVLSHALSLKQNGSRGVTLTVVDQRLMNSGQWVRCTYVADLRKLKTFGPKR